MPMFPTFLSAGAMWDSTPSQMLLKHHEAIEAQDAGDPAPASDTLSRLLDLLDEHGEDDYGVLDPTQYSFRAAFTLVRNAQKQMVFRIAGSPSVDSVGGIRVTWRREDREIRLVCPARRAEQVYIYQQSERRNQAIHGVTPTILADKLSWLISGGDIL
jgi:hypothetical protein